MFLSGDSRIFWISKGVWSHRNHGCWFMILFDRITYIVPSMILLGLCMFFHISLFISLF